ncbi:MAG: DUF952 domain-containing protein [Planctomycetota bacterium]
MSIILHITTRESWKTAEPTGVYTTPNLREGGFIHLSTPAQTAGTANLLFEGRRDLVLLVVDTDRLTAELKYEDTEGAGQDFPHLYGPLPCDAVVDVLAFPPGVDGVFRLPETKWWPPA